VKCATCLWWKQRDWNSGTCWKRAEEFPAPRTTTHAESLCHKWLAKVKMVTGCK
jgi:hypothetical protein